MRIFRGLVSKPTKSVVIILWKLAKHKKRCAPFVGGFYGQLVSGLLWLISAGLAAWSHPRAAITMLVVGGLFTFPLTELFVRLGGVKGWISANNSLRKLGMQVAFVLPASMPLLVPSNFTA